MKNIVHPLPLWPLVKGFTVMNVIDLIVQLTALFAIFISENVSSDICSLIFNDLQAIKTSGYQVCVEWLNQLS